MSTYIVGFVCTLILAGFLIAWIAFCMFCRERHKPERYQYDISDLRRKNFELAQEQKESNTKEITAGIFILPSRHKQKDDNSYNKRPDYPEGPVTNLQPRTDKLIEIFNENSPDVEPIKNVGFDIDSDIRFHSDV
ncbi:uncharacterized protein LOC123661537 isoform X1 [Melitaea cinxia]|uniref:uncharacterized protein LOC123661537 isoform X1 n=1 Tax=Melitaea cinxia TaxID=113334 RepID=UPI001E27346B|nr:uncharacterized protein LOC123661537 isoform X1 [Melitaea cinxia]